MDVSIGGRLMFGMTYQELLEIMSPGLIITVFGGMSGERLDLFLQVCDDDMVKIGHCWKMVFFW